MAIKNGLTKPAGASGVLAAVKGSDSRVHRMNNASAKQPSKPKPYTRVRAPALMAYDFKNTGVGGTLYGAPVTSGNVTVGGNPILAGLNGLANTAASNPTTLIIVAVVALAGVLAVPKGRPPVMLLCNGWNPEADSYIERAMSVVGVEAMRREVGQGIAQLWRFTDEHGTCGYAVTRMEQYPEGKEWCWVACAGRNIVHYARLAADEAMSQGVSIRVHLTKESMRRWYRRLGFRDAEFIMRRDASVISRRQGFA